MNVDDAFDNVADQYDDLFLSPVDLAENSTTFEHLSRIPGIEDGRVIDLGCGTGLPLDYLDFQDYTGIDVSEKMLEKARDKHPEHTFTCRSMDQLYKFGAKSFDYVISTFGSFSFSTKPDIVSTGVFHVLQPGGWFFIQALGPRYRNRKMSVGKGAVDWFPYTKHRLRNLFYWAENVDIFGINFLGEKVPALMLWESETLLHKYPDLGYFVTIIGQRKYSNG